MQKNNISYMSNILVSGIVAVTLIMTPGLNKDSLIIPKLIVLFCLALFLIPVILQLIKSSISNSHVKNLIILISVIFFNGILILINSKSPIDQLLFGRTGRGLGFITFTSILIVTLASAIFFKFHDMRLILKSIVVAGLFTSTYSCVQYFGFDIFKWDSKNNGIIGTLGNPNSQSSFAAMVFIPTVIYFWTSRYKWLTVPSTLLILLFTVYISQSIQGYVGLISAAIAFTLFFYWYRNKIIFISVALLSLIAGVIAIFGTLGHGSLSYYLYKNSIQSRGDFWRSALTTGFEHPIFGVGFDSFGDYSLKYRDEIAASHSFAEYTDSAHNFYLDYFATGGFLFLLLHILLTLLTLSSFYILQRNYGYFNKYLATFFCAWFVIQLQSIINTQSITFLSWNALLSGAIIGMAGNSVNLTPEISVSKRNPSKTTLPLIKSLVMVFIGFAVMFPYFDSDRLIIKASNSGNGDLLVKAATSYPQSVTKYSQASRALLESGLPDASLFLAKKAVEFNPHAVSLWALILVNQTASIEDRQRAKLRILELDPFNNEVKNILIQ